MLLIFPIFVLQFFILWIVWSWFQSFRFSALDIRHLISYLTFLSFDRFICIQILSLLAIQINLKISNILRLFCAFYLHGNTIWANIVCARNKTPSMGMWDSIRFMDGIKFTLSLNRIEENCHCRRSGEQIFPFSKWWECENLSTLTPSPLIIFFIHFSIVSFINIFPKLHSQIHSVQRYLLLFLPLSHFTIFSDAMSRQPHLYFGTKSIL